MTKTDTYVAVLCDVIASRRLAPAPRAKLQREIRASLGAFNARWRRHLVGRFALTRGDEFECLLDSAEPVWEIAHGVRSRFTAVDWIIACGRGPLATRAFPRALAPELDGPCFHAARAALEPAKAGRRVFAFGGFGERLDALAAYYSPLNWSWTPRQRRGGQPPRLFDLPLPPREPGAHPPPPSPP